MNKRNLSTSDWHRRFLQQAAWTTAIRNYLFKKANSSLNNYILEVGCGTCAILSQLQDRGKYHFGLDIDYTFLKFSSEQYRGLHLAQGDGCVMPYSSNVFDVVFCHYLLLWVNNPEHILREFARVGKPGAKVILFAEPDYGGRIDFPPTLQSLGHAQTKSLQQQGADPMVGRKLLKFSKSVGLKIIESGVLGSQSSGEIDQQNFENEWEILISDLSDVYSEQELQRFKQIEQQAWMDGTRVLYVPTFYLLAEI